MQGHPQRRIFRLAAGTPATQTDRGAVNTAGDYKVRNVLKAANPLLFNCRIDGCSSWRALPDPGEGFNLSVGVMTRHNVGLAGMRPWWCAPWLSW